MKEYETFFFARKDYYRPPGRTNRTKAENQLLLKFAVISKPKAKGHRS